MIFTSKRRTKQTESGTLRCDTIDIFLVRLLLLLLLLQERDFLLDVVVEAYQRRASQRAAINAMPLYPTEGMLWDTTQIPTGRLPLQLAYMTHDCACRVVLCKYVYDDVGVGVHVSRGSACILCRTGTLLVKT